MKVGVIGLGKVGLPLACTIVRRWRRVSCWDIDENVRQRLAQHLLRSDEPDVNTTFDGYPDAVRVLPPDEMARVCDAVYIVVPTPSLEDGSFSSLHVSQALGELNRGLVQRVQPHNLVVILVSTVSPGTCDELMHSLIPRAEFIYAPTFIALGSVIHDLTFPRVQLIGHFDKQHAYSSIVHELYSHVRNVHHMSYREAEIAKLAFNAYLTLKITFANHIGWLAHMNDCNVDTVLNAIGDDPRIGHGNLRAGGTYGGPCLPRDNAALTHAYGNDTFPMFAWTDKHNHNHLLFILDLITEELAVTGPEGSAWKFHVVGSSYKIGVTHTIESFGEWLRAALEDYGWKHVEQRDADVIVIAQPVHDDIELRDSSVRVFDVWRARPDLKDKCRYTAFGGTPS